MKTVSMGSNEIRDCKAIVSLGGKPLFDFQTSDTSVLVTFELQSPPAKTAIKVINNTVVTGEKVFVDLDHLRTSIRWQDHTLLQIDASHEPPRVTLDLRPVGLAVYSDDTALHIGTSRVSGNLITNCETGITIGD